MFLLLRNMDNYNAIKNYYGLNILNFNKVMSYTLIDTEKGLIDKLFENATKVLSEEDRKLPAVINIIPLIRRGIGIHHGGKYC